MPVARTLVCVILFATCTVAVGGDRSLNIALQTKGMSTYYVPVDIAGWGLVDMLVDTGSSYSTISQSALDRLLTQGRAVYLRDLTGILADGSNLTVPVYRIDAVRIGDECWFNDVEAAVLPGSSRYILGLSVLRKASRLQIGFDPPMLTFHECETLG